MIQDSADFHQTACQKAANSIRETEQLKNSCFHPKDIIKSSGIKLSEKNPPLFLLSYMGQIATYAN
jgi:hypothetical protein